MNFRFQLMIACILVLFQAGRASSVEQPSISQKPQAPTEQEKLAGTIRRYFESSGSFHANDLISRSQIRGLQIYLKRVGQSGIASNPRVTSLVLPDKSRLIQTFYKKHGAEVLRKASAKLGGYYQLDMLSREVPGLMAIQEAAAAKDHRKLVEYVLSRSIEPSDVEQDSEQIDKQESTQDVAQAEKRGIYTVDQFIEVVTSVDN